MVAGLFADRVGRRPLGIAAPTVLGLAFPVFLLGRHRQARMAVQTPVMVGFGRTVLADAGSLYGAARTFGAGLGLMVAAIGAGMWALGQLTGPSLPVAAALATAALVVGAPLGTVAMPPEKLVYRPGRFGLSGRELEVARYLLAGAELGEILARLSISKNTLKSHIRSIYHKTGARSRHELILPALRFEESPLKAGDVRPLPSSPVTGGSLPSGS